MSGTPMEPSALVDAVTQSVTRAVRTEIDAIVIPRDLSLVDFDAERALLSALMAEYVDHDALPPLEPKHFASAVHGALWELLRHTTNVPSLTMALREQGHIGAVGEMLLDIACEVPVYPPGYLTEQAARVLDSWRRRTYVADLRTQIELVNAGLVDPRDTADALRKLFKEIRSS